MWAQVNKMFASTTLFVLVLSHAYGQLKEFCFLDPDEQLKLTLSSPNYFSIGLSDSLSVNVLRYNEKYQIDTLKLSEGKLLIKRNKQWLSITQSVSCDQSFESSKCVSTLKKYLPANSSIIRMPCFHFWCYLSETFGYVAIEFMDGSFLIRDDVLQGVAVNCFENRNRIIFTATNSINALPYLVSDKLIVALNISELHGMKVLSLYNSNGRLHSELEIMGDTRLLIMKHENLKSGVYTLVLADENGVIETNIVIVQ